MDQLLEDITPQDLFEFARAVPVPEEFVLTRRFIPTRKIPGIRWRHSSRISKTSAAKFRAWDTETPRGRRVVSRMQTEGELPPLGIKFHIGEREQILLDAIRYGDDANLVDLMYDDAERSVLGIYAAGGLGAFGISSISDDEYNVDIDWDMPDEHKPSVTNWWGTDAATPLDDEEGVIRLLTGKSKPRPAFAISSYENIADLGANLQYRNEYFGTANQTSLRSLDPAEVNSVRARKGMPQLVEYDVSIDVDGVDVRVLPTNRVIYVPADPTRWAETQYGTTAEANTLVAGGQLEIERSEESGIIVTKKVHDEPISVTTRSNATAMPVCYDNEGHVSLKVRPGL
jgi:hypothetical protein